MIAHFSVINISILVSFSGPGADTGNLQLAGKNYLSDSQFQMIPSMISWFKRRNIMKKGHKGADLFNSAWLEKAHRGKPSQREGERPDKDQGCSSVTHPDT